MVKITYNLANVVLLESVNLKLNKTLTRQCPPSSRMALLGTVSTNLSNNKPLLLKIRFIITGVPKNYFRGKLSFIFGGKFRERCPDT